AARARPAALPPTARRRPGGCGGVMAAEPKSRALDVELRRLQVRDLGGIEAIERRSYPTPWSRSMFAAELAKPTSLCVGAFDVETGELAGYLIVSRYVDAWHVMNLAVAPDARRHGIASQLLRHLFDATADQSQRGYTLEVRPS